MISLQLIGYFSLHLCLVPPKDAQWNRHGHIVQNVSYSERKWFLGRGQTIFVVDQGNLMEWKLGVTDGPQRIGDISMGDGSHPLRSIFDVVVDEDSVFVCDGEKRRVMLWSNRWDKNGEIFIDNIDCHRLALDDRSALYVSMDSDHVVKRYDVAKTNGTVVAGGNGPGADLNQLYLPRGVAVDRDYSVYVCDLANHRIMKWPLGAKEGIIFADRRTIFRPAFILIDSLGTVYAANGFDKIGRWSKGQSQAAIIVGGRCSRAEEHPPSFSQSFAFDPDGNVYVSHSLGAHRQLQKFMLLKDWERRDAHATVSQFHPSCSAARPNITDHSRWSHQPVRVSGISGTYTPHTRVRRPMGICLDPEGDTLLIADQGTDRIMQTNLGIFQPCQGDVVAGGHGRGQANNQFFLPRHVVVDGDSLIVCDYYNERVMRWPRQNGSDGQVMLENISCGGLALDDRHNLYVSEPRRDEVRRYRLDDRNGTVVAGGNGKGSGLNQLNDPGYLFVDQNHSLYVSDFGNDRVMKWAKEASEGVVVAGGNGQGNSTHQLDCPNGIFVDEKGTVYVADSMNQRVMRWPKDALEGSVVIDGTVQDLVSPQGLSFDRYGNLYVADSHANEVKKFFIIY